MAESGHRRTASIVSGLTATSLASPSTGADNLKRYEFSGKANSVAQLVYSGRDPLTSGYKAPTVRDIPQLKLPKLELVDDVEFENYIENLGPEFDSIELTQVDGSPQLQSLDSMPSVFFDEDFNLDNPRVFDSVSETRVDDNASLPDSTILQEKLSWYIDTIELHLIHEISEASGSFFTATSQFNEIEHQAGFVVGRLKSLKETLQSVKSEIVDQGLGTVELSRKLQKILNLSQCLDQVAKVQSVAREAHALADEGDYFKSLELVDALQAYAHGATEGFPSEWLVGFAFEPADLSGFMALAPTLDKLNQLKSKAGNSYKAQLNDLLSKDINGHILRVPLDDTLHRLGKVLKVPRSIGSKTPPTTFNTSYLEVSPKFRSQLEEIINGATKARVLESASTNFREDILKEVKAIIKQELPGKGDADSISSGTSSRTVSQGDKGAALALALRQLSSSDFEDMMKRLFVHLSEVFRRLSTLQKLLLDISSRVGALPMDLGDLLETVVLSSDARLAKILRTRRDQTANGSLEEFIRFYSLTGIFLSECEAVCGVYPPELSGFLHAETKAYMQKMHDSHLSELENALNLDPWKKEEVPRQIQSKIDLIVESGSIDPPSWLRLWRSVIDIDDANNDVKSAKMLPQNIFVENESFFISRSGAKLLTLLEENLKLLCLLPQVTNDASGTILELLRLYNSRSRNLILGAEAMKSGSGLKRISFRHMSMTSETLGFAMSLIPSISKCIKRHLPNESSQRVQDIELLVANIAVHQEDIHRKFISLMTEKIEMYSRSISSTNWAVESRPASNYMIGMVKDLGTVARILEDTLSAKATSQSIMGQIFDIYKPRLLEAYTTPILKTWDEKDNMMVDVAYFRDNIGNVTGSGNIGEIIYMTVDGFAAPQTASTTPQAGIEQRRSADIPRTSDDLQESIGQARASTGRVDAVEKSSDGLLKVPESLSEANQSISLGDVTFDSSLISPVDEANTPNLSTSDVLERNVLDDLPQASNTLLQDDSKNASPLQSTDIIDNVQPAPELANTSSHEDNDLSNRSEDLDQPKLKQDEALEVDALATTDVNEKPDTGAGFESHSRPGTDTTIKVSEDTNSQLELASHNGKDVLPSSQETSSSEPSAGAPAQDANGDEDGPSNELKTALVALPVKSVEDTLPVETVPDSDEIRDVTVDSSSILVEAKGETVIDSSEPTVENNNETSRVKSKSKKKKKKGKK